jgi:hypothetical protein
MKFRLRVPRPEHKESDILDQEEWKKKSAPVRLENQKGEPRKRRRRGASHFGTYIKLKVDR